MSSANLRLFHALNAADSMGVQQALAAGADINATDARGRNVVSYAALGNACVSLLFLDFMLITPQDRLSAGCPDHSTALKAEARRHEDGGAESRPFSLFLERPFGLGAWPDTTRHHVTAGHVDRDHGFTRVHSRVH